jgi:hypothetical protein
MMLTIDEMSGLVMRHWGNQITIFCMAKRCDPSIFIVILLIIIWKAELIFRIVNKKTMLTVSKHELSYLMTLFVSLPSVEKIKAHLYLNSIYKSFILYFFPNYC